MKQKDEEAEPCFKEGCNWGEGFKNPPALAVPAEGQLEVHHRASFPAAGEECQITKRKLGGTLQHHHGKKFHELFPKMF